MPRRLAFILPAVLGAHLAGCGHFRPRPLADVPFWDPVETRTDGPVTVSVGVLSPDESKAAFSADMAKKGIQPVYLRIENRDDIEYAFFPIVVDRDYFSPHEAAWICHAFLGGKSNVRMDEYFFEQGIPTFVPPSQTVAGIVYTNLRSGVKVVTVELVGVERNRPLRRFEFIMEVPGLRREYEQVDFKALYGADEILHLTEDSLRAELERFPCCTLGPDRKTPGDPLNLVVVGTGDEVLAAFVRCGWDLTETITADSTLKTAWSSLFRKQYKTSPVSALYVYDRPQDAALQKARGTVDERNHLRLWLSPATCDGRPVWIGQISRDIGVRLSSKTFVTHKIDPNVDEAREYLIQDLVTSQWIAKLGYAGGVGRAGRPQPRQNFTGDPYFTDGMRAVLFIAERPTSYDEVELLAWQYPDPDWRKAQ